MLLNNPTALAGEGDRYLTNAYQNDPADWNDPWRDNTVGPRNQVSTIDGHIGSGVRVTIDEGEHFGAAMRWRFVDNGFEEPEHLWFRYYLRFPDEFPQRGQGETPWSGRFVLVECSRQPAIYPIDPGVVGPHVLFTQL